MTMLLALHPLSSATGIIDGSLLQGGDLAASETLDLPDPASLTPAYLQAG
jgi:hypothetical protein